jgi:hypothetical protein
MVEQAKPQQKPAPTNLPLTRNEFIGRLMDAGWTRTEAVTEWDDMEREPEDDWEGQL